MICDFFLQFVQYIFPNVHQALFSFGCIIRYQCLNLICKMVTMVTDSLAKIKQMHHYAQVCFYGIGTILMISRRKEISHK